MLHRHMQYRHMQYRHMQYRHMLVVTCNTNARVQSHVLSHARSHDRQRDIHPLSHLRNPKTGDEYSCSDAHFPADCQWLLCAQGQKTTTVLQTMARRRLLSTRPTGGRSCRWAHVSFFTACAIQNGARSMGVPARSFRSIMMSSAMDFGSMTAV